MAAYDNKVLTGDQLVYYSGLIKTALAAKADASALAGKQNAFSCGDGLLLNQGIMSVNIDIDDDAEMGFLEITDDGEGKLLLHLIWEDLTTEKIIAGEDQTTGDPIMLSNTLNSINGAISNKQDALVFNTAYNASSNKVATMSDITTALSGISSFSFEIVNSLPSQDISTSKIYLVAKATSGTNQVYTEYAYVNNAWEIIGDTSMTIDTLSNSEVSTIWSTATATV